jgi:hypothetical protein
MPTTLMEHRGNITALFPDLTSARKLDDEAYFLDRDVRSASSGNIPLIKACVMVMYHVFQSTQTEDKAEKAKHVDLAQRWRVRDVEKDSTYASNYLYITSEVLYQTACDRSKWNFKISIARELTVNAVENGCLRRELVKAWLASEVPVTALMGRETLAAATQVPTIHSITCRNPGSTYTLRLHTGKKTIKKDELEYDAEEMRELLSNCSAVSNKLSVALFHKRMVEAVRTTEDSAPIRNRDGAIIGFTDFSVSFDDSFGFPALMLNKVDMGDIGLLLPEQSPAKTAYTPPMVDHPLPPGIGLEFFPKKYKDGRTQHGVRITRDSVAGSTSMGELDGNALPSPAHNNYCVKYHNIKTSLITHWAGYINHAPAPHNNVEWVQNEIHNHDLKAGQELFVDYGLRMWVHEVTRKDYDKYWKGKARATALFAWMHKHIWDYSDLSAQQLWEVQDDEELLDRLQGFLMCFHGYRVDSTTTLKRGRPSEDATAPKRRSGRNPKLVRNEEEKSPSPSSANAFVGGLKSPVQPPSSSNHFVFPPIVIETDLGQGGLSDLSAVEDTSPPPSC